MSYSIEENEKHLYYIPKGSQMYDGNVFISTTIKDFNVGYIAKETDFTPELEKGTIINVQRFFYNDELIYIHPNFIQKPILKSK